MQEYATSIDTLTAHVSFFRERYISGFIPSRSESCIWHYVQFGVPLKAIICQKDDRVVTKVGR
jgi:hypothetical protein